MIRACAAAEFHTTACERHATSFLVVTRLTGLTLRSTASLPSAVCRPTLGRAWPQRNRSLHHPKRRPATPFKSPRKTKSWSKPTQMLVYQVPPSTVPPSTTTLLLEEALGHGRVIGRKHETEPSHTKPLLPLIHSKRPKLAPIHHLASTSLLERQGRLGPTCSLRAADRGRPPHGFGVWGPKVQGFGWLVRASGLGFQLAVHTAKDHFLIWV